MEKIPNQNEKELIGRRVCKETKDRGWSLEDLHSRTSAWSKDQLSQLLAGQPLFLSRLQRVDLVKALSLNEGRNKDIEELTDEELESLFYPTPPEQQPPEQLELGL